MTTLYVTEPRAFVRKQGRTLVVKREDDTVRIPLERVTDVVFQGDVSFSGAALRELAEAGISIGYVDARGRWVGRWEPAEPKTVLLRREQYRAADDAEKTLAVARQFVIGKLRNCRILLLRARREGVDIDEGAIERLAELRRLAELASDLDSLRGFEGDAAAVYFPQYGRLVSVNGFSFQRRVRRPPVDEVNAMLSFGYALLTHVSATAARIAGFDAHLGYLHAMRYGRPSLALDLMEEFRPIIVDALVAALIRLKMVQISDFERSATEVRLNDASRRTFLIQFERKLESEVRHPVLDRQASHRRALEVQARLLAKYLTGEVPAYVPFAKR